MQDLVIITTTQVLLQVGENTNPNSLFLLLSYPLLPVSSCITVPPNRLDWFQRLTIEIAWWRDFCMIEPYKTNFSKSPSQNNTPKLPSHVPDCGNFNSYSTLLKFKVTAAHHLEFGRRPKAEPNTLSYVEFLKSISFYFFMKILPVVPFQKMLSNHLIVME